MVTFRRNIGVNDKSSNRTFGYYYKKQTILGGVFYRKKQNRSTLIISYGTAVCHGKTFKKRTEPTEKTSCKRDELLDAFCRKTHAFMVH